jgi:hypothetical protein
LFIVIDPYNPSTFDLLFAGIEALRDFLENPDFYPKVHFQLIVPQMPSIGTRTVTGQALWGAGFISTLNSLLYANSRKGRLRHYRHEGQHLKQYELFPLYCMLSPPFFQEGLLYAADYRCDFSSVELKAIKLFFPSAINRSLWEGEEKSFYYSSSYIIFEYLLSVLEQVTGWKREILVEKIIAGMDESLKYQENAFFAFWETLFDEDGFLKEYRKHLPPSLQMWAIDAFLELPEIIEKNISRFTDI